MSEVIFKHIDDKKESVLFQGSMTDCKKHIAALKADAEKHFSVSKWCNGGFMIPNTYYIELR